LATVGLLLFVAAAFGGCASDAQNGAVLGGLLGAGTGAVIGHQSDEAWAGAGIGAAAGALGGYLIGNEMDKDPRRSHNNHPQYEY
jgi:uncharacterized protein YcfJ